MEARLDTLTNAVEVMQQLMMKNTNQGRNQTCHKVLGASESETTIYHNALRPLPGESMAGSVNKAIIPLHLSDKPDKRVSSSLEEDGPIDTSDELIDGAVIAQLNVLSAGPGQDGLTGQSQAVEQDPQPSTCVCIKTEDHKWQVTTPRWLHMLIR